MLVVVALGGNAIDERDSGGGVQAQRSALRRASAGLADLVEAGHRIVVTHGNGPQVGALLLQQRSAREVPPMPLDVLVAQTQGQIGYLLGQQLDAELRARGVRRAVVPLLSQVVVAPDDAAMTAPDKPVGPFYTATELEHLTGATVPAGAEPWTVDGAVYRRVEAGLWRRVVASPRPLEIVELEAIEAVVASGGIPVCAGGGGVPVTRTGDALRGVEAVVDKDRTAALLARGLGADALLILTAVDRVRLDFGGPDERPVAHLTHSEAEEHLAAGEFPAGSMGPKVAAAVEVAGAGGMAAIGALGDAAAVLDGRAGTRITG